MRYIIDDRKYHFKAAFDTESGAYVRTGILDENGKDMELPVFMQGTTLPDDYFKPQDPYKVAPSCKVRIRAMMEYAHAHGKRCWDLTKEEFEQFKVG